MLIKIADSRSAMGKYVADQAAEHLRQVLASQPEANLVVATGSSQFEVLDCLVQTAGVDWSRINGFHLDEYLGLAKTHSASFCGYLRQRFVDRLPLKSFFYLEGTIPPEKLVQQASDRLRGQRIDLLLCGIGENAHLAFNDPPADFETKDVYKIVELNEACRKQQVGEGWFDSLAQVPTQAISMTIYQILQAERILCSVPDRRKADAVKATLEGEITPEVPASALRHHKATTLILDSSSSCLLSQQTLTLSDRIRTMAQDNSARYVDLQVNGFMGVDFNDPHLPAAEILKAAQAMRAGGVETALATIITGPLDAMCQCIANVAQAIDNQNEVAKTIGGLHIEGPFLSPVKGYIGAHPADCVLGDDVDALERLLTAGRGHVKLVTLAPEVDPDNKLIKHLVRQGIMVAAGHTDASVDQLQRAIDAGLQLFTHIGNACPQVCHRHDNILQRAMSLAPQLKTTFIADGWHLPSFVVKNLLRMASLEHFAVVSDAIAAAGLGPGEFQLGAYRVKVGPDKCARSPDGQHFVGAASTMADADAWLSQVVGLSDDDRQILLYDNPRKWLSQS